MEMLDPIYVYDTRTQLTRPVFVAYEHDQVDAFLMALDKNPGPGWVRPDWALVTMQRMHDFEKPRYKVGFSNPLRGITRTNRPDANAMARKVRELSLLVNDKDKKIEELTNQIKRWETETSSMTNEAARKLLAQMLSEMPNPKKDD